MTETATIEQDAATAAAEDVAEQAEPTLEERVKAIENDLLEQLTADLMGAIEMSTVRARAKQHGERIKDLERRMLVAEEELTLHVEALDKLQESRLPAYSEVLTASSDNTHIRVQTTKNTKGYSFETTVSVDGADSEQVRQAVQQLLVDANTIARQEVERLELLDGQS